jgi:predicted PurR-regulated permease PerM
MISEEDFNLRTEKIGNTLSSFIALLKRQKIVEEKKLEEVNKYMENVNAEISQTKDLDNIESLPEEEKKLALELKKMVEQFSVLKEQANKSVSDLVLCVYYLLFFSQLFIIIIFFILFTADSVDLSREISNTNWFYVKKRK